MGKPVKLTDQGKAWAKRLPLTRKVDVRPLRERILIVCEGIKTEPFYFKAISSALPPRIVEVDVQGEGANTQSLVDGARRHRDRRAGGDYPYDEVWVVFDRDSFAPAAFDNAIHSAEGTGMKVAWSNEAFELWYILHFEDRQTGMSREDYQVCLTGHLNEPYKKNDPHMYRKLAEQGDEALASRRAAALIDAHEGLARHEVNPGTTVHRLVEKLNSFRVPVSLPV